MSRPVVSIVIPTYNRAQTLTRAIESIRAQSFQDWEIIVVDDGSTDSTPNLLSNYAARLGQALMVIRQYNRGCSAARNRGIEMARGRYVAFLDSDDEFRPQKLERQLELFNASPGLDFVYSDYSFVDLEGRTTISALDAKFPIARSLSTTRVADRMYAVGPDLFSALLTGYFVATIVGVVRRESIGCVRFDEQLSYAEEWLFFLQLARTRRAGFIDEPLAVHHYTEGSLTRTDKARNLIRQCQLFHAMAARLENLHDADAQTLANHLARAHAQLARHHQDTGSRARAILHTARSHYYRRKAGPAHVKSS